MLIGFVLFINTIIIWYFLVINVCYITLLFTSISDILSRYKEVLFGNVNSLVNSTLMPPVAVIISAFNEEKDIVDTISSLVKSTYANTRIFIINDGSTDHMMEKLITTFELIAVPPVIPQKIKTIAHVKHYYTSKILPNLTVIDKEHSGKADSLNIGINACAMPIFVTLDADTILEPEAIGNLVFSMLSHPHTIAEGGAIYILNGCEYKDGVLIERKMPYRPLPALQTIEYLRAFLFGRTGWKVFGGPLILSGALTLFETQAVVEIGGYVLDSPGEDMEIVVHLHEKMRVDKTPCRISYNFAASAWTNVPETMGKLWRQRNRWHRGLIDSLMRHKKLFFNPGYGAVGLFSYPFHILGEFLAPLIEFIGYLAVAIGIYFHIIDWDYVVIFFIASWGLATLVTMSVALISFISFNKYRRLRDLIFILILVAVENFGYRQILVLCRVIATFQYVFQKLFSSGRKEPREGKSAIAWDL